jgi:hypothetical protein
MSYTNYIVLIIPEDAAIIATAKAASRTLDPDIGGYEAFEQVVTDGTDNYRIYASPITAATAAAIPQMQVYPAALKAKIDADIAERWPGETAPTLAEVTAFTAALRMYPDMGIEAAMVEAGITQPEEARNP